MNKAKALLLVDDAPGFRLGDLYSHQPKWCWHLRRGGRWKHRSGLRGQSTTSSLHHDARCLWPTEYNATAGENSIRHHLFQVSSLQFDSVGQID